jgi:hypothetical protein
VIADDPHNGPNQAPSSDPAPTVLHSSLTGMLLSFGGVGVLVVLAVVSVVGSVGSSGSGVIAGVLSVVAGLGVSVMMFDMPISSSFDATGVTRRALLRHQRLRWDDVDRLSRARKGMFRSSKMAPTGGLIAVRGRRNYTLVDRMEGHVEYAHLRESLGDAGERLGIDRLAQPARDQTPTWLHRRAKWAPTSTGDR